jgi:hypothetical protein
MLKNVNSNIRNIINIIVQMHVYLFVNELYIVILNKKNGIFKTIKS